MPFNLGIDESNHGRFPEVFVAVLSYKPEDVERVCDLPKKRTYRSPINIQDILGNDRDYRQIIVSAEQSKRLGGPYSVQAHVIATFMHCFGDLDQVIVDGELSPDTLETLGSLVSPGTLRNSIWVPDGDKIFPLVNVADRLSYIFFRQQDSMGSEAYGELHHDTILPLELEVPSINRRATQALQSLANVR